MQRKIMNVRDAEVGYASTKTIGALGELIGNIIGSPAAGRRLVGNLVLSGEEATLKNAKDRLRLLLVSEPNIPGLTDKQSKSLQSAWTFAKELYFPELEVGTVVDDPAIAAEAFKPMSWNQVEKFGVLSLDTKCRILSSQILSTGTATETAAHPRDIFSAIMRAGGTQFIVAHNHPSGSLEPSKGDIQLTEQLLRCSKNMDIPMLDHLILSRGEWSSIRTLTDLWAE